MPRAAKSSPFETHLALFMDSHDPRASGMRVIEPAPGTPEARRGNLYVLLELMGQSPTHNEVLRQMQVLVEEVYYSATGSVSAVLGEAIQAAHEVLHEINQHNPGTDLRAGIICAAIVNDYLIMASAGPSLAMFSTNQRVDQFPPGPRHYTGPLGGREAPQVSFYRQQIRDGDVLFLGESDWILLTTVKTLAAAVTTSTPENRFDVIAYLRKQINNAEILGLFVIFADEQQPIARVPAAKKVSGLPTALGATPPIHDIPTVDNVSAVWEDGSTRPRPKAPGSGQRAAGQPRVRRYAADEIEVMEPDEKRTLRRTLGSDYQVGAVIGRLSRWTQRTSSQMASWLTRILPDRDRGAQQPPDWVGALPEIEAGEGDDERDNEKIRQSFSPPERTGDGRARLFILLAILIPLLTFATVGAVYLQRGASNNAEGLKLVELAESQLLKAQQALGVDDKSTARTALNEAQRYIDEAIALIGMTEQVSSLSEQIGAELNRLRQVRSLYSLDFPLHTFPPDADPHRAIVFDQDVYVLDIGRQVVEFFRTDPNRSIVEENHGAIIREGDVVEGITVGRLVDIAWQQRIPGFADKASLLILDRNNNIFRYNNVDEVTYMRLAGSDQLRGVSQIENYSGRLYLLDEQQNQIWRYSPAGLGYDEAPTAWFDPQVQADLAGVVATAIDGDIWMLTEDGMVLRYRQGGQLPFSLDNSAGLNGRMVDMTLGTESTDNVYLADGSQDRILVFDKEGNYVEQFQAAENNALRGLRGLYLDNVTGTLFILTQSSLYAHSLPK